MWLPLTYPHTEDLAGNPGICPDWESNWWRFDLQTSTQSTEPYQPGHYLFIFRERGSEEKERKRNINVCLPLTSPLLGTWPTTQACAKTGNWTCNPLQSSAQYTEPHMPGLCISFIRVLFLYHWVMSFLLHLMKCI